MTSIVKSSQTMKLMCLVFVLTIVTTSASRPRERVRERISTLRGCERKQELEESNKKIAIQFYQDVLGDKNPDAVDKYVAEDGYVQHNPDIPDGREALKKTFRHLFKDKPKETIEVQRVVADGDYVWVHWKSNLRGKLESVIDILKMKDGKFIEHWDVFQEFPKSSKNDHPLF